MFSLALRWGMRRDGVNPAKGIEKNVEHHRRRYLKGDEMAGLLKALAAYPNEQLADAVRLLLLTGARRGEILALRSRSRRRHLVKAAQQHETESGA
jgi:integrase